MKMEHSERTGFLAESVNQVGTMRGTVERWKEREREPGGKRQEQKIGEGGRGGKRPAAGLPAGVR